MVAFLALPLGMVLRKFGNLDAVSVPCGKYLCCSVSVISTIIMSGLILLPCVAYPASQVVPASLRVLYRMLNVRVWQHNLGYLLAVPSNVLEYVCCTYICNHVMATFYAFCVLFY